MPCLQERNATDRRKDTWEKRAFKFDVYFTNPSRTLCRGRKNFILVESISMCENYYSALIGAAIIEGKRQ